MDDNVHEAPTYKNIMNAFRNVVRQSKAVDKVFLHFTGHSGRVEESNNDEENVTLVPVD